MISLENLYRAYNGICYWCDKPVNRDDATREHLWPKMFGGPNISLNLRLAHKTCNKNRIPERFWRLMRVEDDCWVFEGENIQVIRSLYRESKFDLTPLCGTSKCVRPDHMVGI